MSKFGGGTVFGTGVFGGDPTPFLLYQIDAEMTTEARRLMARSLTDGTVVVALRFSVGRGGFDPYDYLAAIPVNPDAQALHDPVFTDAIDRVEHANETAKVFYCVLEPDEATETLGEVAILAEVHNSPGDPIDETEIVFAIGHFPLLVHAPEAAVPPLNPMRIVLRVSVQA